MAYNQDYQDNFNVKNFRDLGDSINRIYNKIIMPVNIIYRGGVITDESQLEHLPEFATIINLRTKQDDIPYTGKLYHIPANNDIEVYDMENTKTINWLRKVMRILVSDDALFPIFIHCSSGKDRTGIVCGVILKFLGIRDRNIIKEYQLSEGNLSTNRFQQALLKLYDIDQVLGNDIGNKLLLKISKNSTIQ